MYMANASPNARGPNATYSTCSHWACVGSVGAHVGSVGACIGSVGACVGSAKCPMRLVFALQLKIGFMF